MADKKQVNFFIAALNYTGRALKIRDFGFEKTCLRTVAQAAQY